MQRRIFLLSRAHLANTELAGQLVLAALLSVGAVLAVGYQTSGSFSAAAIKADRQSISITHSWRVDPKMLSIQAATVMDMLRWSYGLDRHHIEGPRWISEALYDVEARTEATTTTGQKKAMLQNLLANCFRMKVRSDSRSAPVFILGLDRGGAKLVPAKETRPSIDARRTGYTGSAIRMSDFAEDLSDYLGRPVLDRTGLGGRYDVSLSFAAVEPGSDNALPSLFSSIRDTLGLELRAAREPVEMLRVSADSRPENVCTLP